MPWYSFIVSNVLLASILAVAAWLVQRRRRWHGVAHVLWILVLVKLITPPFFSVPLTEPVAKSPCENGTCNCGPHSPTLAQIASPWIVTFWGVGACFTGLIAWRRWARFRLLIEHAEPAPLQWQLLANRLSSVLSLWRRPEILAAPGRLPPLVVAGWRRPCILLPSELIDQIEEPQRTALLLHEMVHLKRCDHLVRFLEIIVGVVYWWLPVTLFIGRQLRACEEACCDAAVVDLEPQARRDYARLLLDVLDFVAPQPRGIHQATALNSAGDLENRLVSILNDDPEKSRGRRPVGVVAIGLACAVLPCELDCQWPQPSTPVVSPVPPMNGINPTPEASASPWVQRHVEAPVKSMCCPS